MLNPEETVELSRSACNIGETLSIKLPNIASINHRQLVNPHPKKVIVKASINEAGRR